MNIKHQPYRQAVVGTKAGKILMVDVASAEVTEAIEAHAAGKEVWGLSATHDGKGFVSASADQGLSQHHQSNVFGNWDLGRISINRQASTAQENQS